MNAAIARRTVASPSTAGPAGGAVAFLVAGAVAVWLWGSTLLVLRATEVVVFIVAFSGLHVLSGRLGLISVGHGAFMGVGAVVAAHAIDDASLPYLLAPLAGAVGGAALGAVIAAPSLRLPGAYLALLTLAVAMVLPIALRRIDGPLGYRLDGDLVAPSWTGLGPGDDGRWQFALVVVGALIIMITVHGAMRGRFTRALIAVRDEPTAAAAFGIQVGRVHVIGVAVSAGLAGAAGGLSLYASPLVSGGRYPFTLSVAMFALMLGLGAARLWTSIPAAVLLVAIPEVLTRAGWARWEPIVYAVVLLVMTRVSRGRGLISLWDRGVAGATVRPVPLASTGPARSNGDAEGARPARPRTPSGNPWLLTPEPTPTDDDASTGLPTPTTWPR